MFWACFYHGLLRFVNDLRIKPSSVTVGTRERIMAFCSNCGAPVDGGRFCPKCGSAVDAGAPAGGQAAPPPPGGPPPPPYNPTPGYSSPGGYAQPAPAAAGMTDNM